MIQKTAFAVVCAFAFSFASIPADVNGQCCSQNSLLAQSFAFRSGGRVITPNPPYFALHPPVYYEGIVKRPYGISPFAAPPGVLPAEMTVKVEPKTVLNPYFDRGENASPAINSPSNAIDAPIMMPEIKQEAKPKKKVIDITTPVADKEKQTVVASKSIANPFYKKKTSLDSHAF